MGPSCGLILASFWAHFCYILAVFLGPDKCSPLLLPNQRSDCHLQHFREVGRNLCTHRTGSALSLMPLSSGYPFLRHVGTASPLRRPKTAPKTAQETSWRPLEPPRDPPGDAKATQETPRRHQDTPRDSNGRTRHPLGEAKAPQEPPKNLPKGIQKHPQTVANHVPESVRKWNRKKIRKNDLRYPLEKKVGPNPLPLPLKMATAKLTCH